MSRSSLPTRRGAGPIAKVPGDYEHLRTVVLVGYPVGAARTYLNRHLGNPVTYRLVEAQRGEPLGRVRAVEVVPVGGGDPSLIHVLRVLPDGKPAGPFDPEDLITTQAEILTPDGRQAGALDPRDKLVLHVPVRSYLRFLPGVFQGNTPATREDVSRADAIGARRQGQRDLVDRSRNVDAEGAEQFQDFLLMFQHLMTTVVERIDQIPSMTDPLTADPRFLPWLASWVGFTLDQSLPLHQQRELVRRAIKLYRTRGTRRGMEEMIKVLTSAPVAVAPRVKPQPFVLGGATLAGGRTFADRFENRAARPQGEPPAFYLYDHQRKPTGFFELVLERRDRFERRFSQQAPAVLRRLSQVVTAEKPAHVTFTIRFEED